MEEMKHSFAPMLMVMSGLQCNSQLLAQLLMNIIVHYYALLLIFQVSICVAATYSHSTILHPIANLVTHFTIPLLMLLLSQSVVTCSSTGSRSNSQVQHLLVLRLSQSALTCFSTGSRWSAQVQHLLLLPSVNQL